MYTDISEELASDPWVKVVDFLQQNWAVVVEHDEKALVVFYTDGRGVFDEIQYDTLSLAEEALRWNGFKNYWEYPKINEVIAIPQGNFHVQEHRNGRIYSSGRFWK